MNRTAHAHPWMGLGIAFLLFVAFMAPRPDADVARLQQTILDQQQQLADLQQSIDVWQAIDQNLAGRIDAIDCDLYGLICPEAEREPTKLKPRAARSHVRQPLTESHRTTSRLNWAALAQCESSGNPRAVNRSGKYRGAFQMDAAFWRTYGGLTYAARPDLATYAQQLAVAQRGYAARGRSPWPECGRRL